MPELPEVETIVRDLLASQLVGQEIVGVAILWDKTLNSLSAQKLLNKKILHIERRGKWIALTLAPTLYLYVHLRMTGRFSHKPGAADRVIFHLGNQQSLFYHDTRKFGRMIVTEKPIDVIGHLGPEPLSTAFAPQKLYAMLQTKKRALKPLLLDQTFIAGLGNIYVDEALFFARLHPQKLSHTLSLEEAQKLHAAIQHVLLRGLKTEGTSLGKGKTNYARLSGERGSHQNHLQVFRRTGQPCPTCQTPIQRIVVAQRSTHYCPHCQEE